MKNSAVWGRFNVYVLLTALLFFCSPAFSQTFASSCSAACHTTAPGKTGGARVNAADADQVIAQAYVNHSMGVAPTLAIQQAVAADIGAGVTARTSSMSVNYGSSVSIGSSNILNVVVNDPQDTALTPNPVITGYGYVNASNGNLSGTGTSTLSYQHTAANCSAETLTVFGVGTGGVQTSNRFINMSVNAPTVVTPTQTFNSVAYNSATATNLTLTGLGFVNSLTLTSNPANGTATVVNGTTISYRSDPNVYNSQVTFGYQGNGPCGATSTGTITINIAQPSNAYAPTVTDVGTAGAPSYVSTSASTDFDLIATSRISGLIQANNPAVAYGVTITQQPSASGGTATVVSGTTIRFTPQSGFTGASNIKYTMSGPGGVSNTGTIYINVTSAPTASNTTASTPYGTFVDVPLAFNSSGAPITGVTLTNAQNGTISQPGGPTSTTIRFTPANLFYGTGSFQYTLTSTAGTSSPAATASITVNPPIPTVSNVLPGAALSVTYNTATIIDLAPYISPSATVTSVTPTVISGGTVAAAPATNATSVLFTPTNGALGAASFSYTATNVAGPSGSATISLNIPTPATPVAVAQSATAISNGANTITLTPTGVYSSLTLGTLPAHGTANLSGATVTYTPQPGYLGADSFTYTATGPGGTSAPATVSITVLAVPTAPAVTRSTLISTPLVLDTTTFATGSFTSVTVSAPGHGTATVSAKVITYTPNANYFGADTFNYTVLGGAAGNATGAVTVNVTPVAVTAAAATMSVPLNSSASLDLTPFISGTAVTGVSIANAPAHGTVTVSGKTVTYAPAHDYFGTDTFKYSAFGASGPSAAAVVTVTITGRPDPTQNAAVTGLVANQSQTALRFSQAQVSNFARHMEGLRRPGGAGLRSGLAPSNGTGPIGLGANNGNNDNNNWAAAPGAATSAFGSTAVSNAYASGMTGALPLPGQSSATRLPTGTSPTASLPVESGVMMAMNQLGVPQSSMVGMLYNLEQNRKLDLGMLKSAFGGDGQTGGGTPGNTVWVEGVVSFGSRDAGGNTDATAYSSSGVSIGMDIPYNDNFTWGVGLGLARDSADIGADGTHTQAQGYSLAAYGSYKVGKNGFVEGMLGMGTIDFDMRRWVDPMSDFALSNRKGTQLFGSIGGGLEYRNNGKMVSPYMRLDFSQDKLQEVSETGAGNYALHFFEQTNNAQQAVLGLRGESTHATSFGWAIPRARVELRQDLLDGSNAVISYADQIGGTRYSIAPTDSRRSALVLGLGSEFLFRDGWSLGVDYQLSRISGSESSYALRMRLNKELGVKGPRKLFILDEEATEFDGDTTVESTVTWDDNVSRAKLGGDIRSDFIYTVNLSRTFESMLTDNIRFLVTGVATGDRFQTFNGLSHSAIGAEGALQYRANGAFATPTWGFTAKVSGDDYQTTIRSGSRYSFGLNVLQPMTERVNLFSAMSYNVRDANSSVFSTQDIALRLNLDYALLNHSNLYFSGEYRDGDIVSSGRQSLENITLARAVVADDAYPGASFSAYRFQGTTWLTTLGYNMGLGARDSLDVSWRYIQATPSQRPMWVTSPGSYVTNQISASYLMRF